MNLAAFLSQADAERAARSVRKLRRHEISSMVLTGGLAVELHLLQRGLPSILRPLNDIDFLVDSFDEIPKALSADLIFHHVHPHDPPGKTLLQSVDPETAVRIDLFRAYGDETARAQTLELAGIVQRMISLEDLVARTARLCLDLASDRPLPTKHARDFLRLLPIADTASIERAWPEHRKAGHPRSFAETANLLERLIPERPHLLVVPGYSRDPAQICPRCQSTPHFPLAGGERVLSLLGYC
ncbi:MAG: hypothetical protein WBE76_28215 [Terracidiphilus sp.]